jgi:subtilisin family serine protease
MSAKLNQLRFLNRTLDQDKSFLERTLWDASAENTDISEWLDLHSSATNLRAAMRAQSVGEPEREERASSAYEASEWGQVTGASLAGMGGIAALQGPSPKLEQPKDGQSNLTSSTAGINLTGAWKEFSGTGINVGIIDDGFDHDHVELESSYNTDWDYDARNKDYNADSSDVDDNHGTAVAGVIAADPNSKSNSGMVGVAYDATIVGFRIGYGTGGESEILDNLKKLNGYEYVDPVTGTTVVVPAMDVVNNSWGYSGAFDDNFNAVEFAAIGAALQANAIEGRDGLGLNTVFAAGNGRGEGDNVNYHNFQNSPYTIAVAATDGAGKIASFSTPGAAVLVSAPGVNIYTTDKSGTGGYTSGDYATVSGTSFAAPTVSGVIALMLQANPDLGYRDVQEILAYSARQTDASSTGWDFNGATNWNGGGLHFSHDYGFGLVDATAAVRLAESWQSTSTYKDPATLGSSAPNGVIKYGSTLTSTIKVGDLDLTTPGTHESLTIDKIVVELDISHSWAGDLKVTLTHVETGTTAVLIANPNTSVGTGSGIQFTTSANNFWGEDTTGTWTLTVTDNYSLDDGTLKSWTLKAVGDTPTAEDLYVFTNEYKGARTLTDSDGGTDSINLAAVTASSTLNLASGTTSTVAGKSLSIAAGTSIENAWLGDGNDIVIGNDLANLLHGGRGIDTASYANANAAVVASLATGTSSDGDIFDSIENLIGSAYADMLEGDGGANVLTGAGGADTLDGRSGLDTASYASAAAAITASLTTRTSSDGDTFISIENLTGSAYADTLTGDGLANVLSGAAGTDKLYGGDAGDVLIGGLGSDRLDGGAGADTASYISATAGVTANLKTPSYNKGEATGDTYYSIENLTGSAFNDTLTGNTYNNVLQGGLGADKLYGDAGSDTASYANAAAAITANLASPSSNLGEAKGDIYSSIENLTGSAFNDTLKGNGSANVLQGGLGADQLYGAAGNDIFVFYFVEDSPADPAAAWDVIGDFAFGDKIDLSLLDLDQTTPSIETFEWANADDTYSAGEVWFEGSFLFGEVDEATAGAEFKIQLANNYVVSSTDVLFG